VRGVADVSRRTRESRLAPKARHGMHHAGGVAGLVVDYGDVGFIHNMTKIHWRVGKSQIIGVFGFGKAGAVFLRRLLKLKTP
jgi:alcohol dehydrogenase class IV